MADNAQREDFWPSSLLARAKVKVKEFFFLTFHQSLFLYFLEEKKKNACVRRGALHEVAHEEERREASMCARRIRGGREESFSGHGWTR